MQFISRKEFFFLANSFSVKPKKAIGEEKKSNN